MATQDSKKLVFISHSSEDKIFVEKLATDLKKYHLPLWFDKWEIKVGDSIVEKINEALGIMTDLVLILSKKSVNSKWVKKELSTALMRKLKDNSVKVLPVLIEECEIPIIIIDLKYADFVLDYTNGFLDLIEALELTITKYNNQIDPIAYVKAQMFGKGDIMTIIQDAGRRKKLLWLEAEEENGSIEPRKVEPYSFRDRGKDGNLLFFAWDIQKNQIRSFRLDRINNVTVLSKSYRPRYPIEF